MAKAFTLGQTADATKVNIIKTESKVSGHTLGTTSVSTLDSGKTANSMEKAST